MDQDRFVKEFLDSNKIEYKTYSHPAVFTVHESHNNPDVKKIPGLRTKSLFLKDNNSNFYLICLGGEKRLNTKLLKSHFKIKSLNFSSPKELWQELKVKPGSVSIFCILNSARTTLVVDKEVLESAESGFHPNINTETIVLSSENLKKFLGMIENRKEILEL